MTALPAEKIEWQEELQAEATDLCTQARAIVVKDQASYVQAGEFLKVLKQMKTKITGYFAPMKQKARAAWQEILDKEKSELEPIDKADAFVRAQANIYLAEQERIRREEQRKAEEEARRVAEIERQRILRQAEKAKTEEKMEELIDKADAVYVEPVVVAPIVEQTTRLNEGSMSKRKDIEVVIVDEKALIRAVASGDVPITIIQFKPLVLKTWCKTAGKKGGDVPGCVIKETVGISVR